MTKTDAQRSTARRKRLTKGLGITGGVLIGLSLAVAVIVFIVARETAGSWGFLAFTGLGCALLLVAGWLARRGSDSRLMGKWKVPWAVLLALGVLILVLGVAAGTDEGQLKLYEIPTEAMNPAIEAGDVVTAKKDAYAADELPERGDIIVFKPTPSATRTCGESQGGNIPFVKRVIGLPGDRVEVRGGMTYVNGEVYEVEHAIRPDYQERWPRVPEDHLLVLGDNRDGSCDSHQWFPDPFVPKDNVIGKVIHVRSSRWSVW